MEILHYQDVDAQDAGEGTSKLSVRWLITKEMGAENFAMRIFEMEPEGCSPFHSHPWEHEVFILEGEGILIGKETERKFEPGDVIFIPSDEKHQFKNNSQKTVKFLCLIPYARE
ncbi:cupin domain-containing protein [Candidatus Bathyarchaeota archaeon]|nr:cupin domain-containing protein [Candidatus Bathyarchaeota archaeon]